MPYHSLQLSNSRFARGQILVLALILFVVVMIISTSLFSRVIMFMQSGSRAVSYEQATNLADAGADYAVWQINQTSGAYLGTNGGNPGCTGAITLGAGQVTIQVQQPSSSNRKITSTSYMPTCASQKVKRVVKVEVVKITTGTLPDTDQTGCWNAAGSPIPCAGTGQDAVYTSANSATCDPNFTDNGNGTVTDNCTSLTWQKCTFGQNPTTCAGGVDRETWTEALSYCQGLSLAGSGWRMPNFYELQSIVNHQFPTAIDMTIFPDTVLGRYWSSTTGSSTESRDQAWTVKFPNEDDNSAVLQEIDKTFNEQIRCVRDAGGPVSSSAVWQIRRGTYKITVN